MLRSTLVLLAALATLAGAQHRLGLIPEDLDTIPGVKRVERVEVAPGRPLCDTVLRVDHSAEMPPVGNQGAQGSCVAFAHGYNHKTHNEFVEHGWDVRDPRHQASPAFLYNQVNGGRDYGTSGSRVMTLEIEQGAGMMADMPYNQYDFVTWPSESAYFNALPYRIEEACFINAADTQGINLARQHIANGYTGVIGIQVWSNFDNIRSFRNTYCSSERYGTMRGWHAVTIVGYDDTLSTSDGPGAFRVVNSWGTGWGDAGYFWMSYVAVMDEQMGGRQVEYARDRVGYQPTLVARLTISHPTRDRVGFELGIAPVMSTPWCYSFRNWRAPQIDRPFPANPMVFDLTEGAEYLTGGSDDVLFIGAVDDAYEGQFGSITGFSVDDLARGRTGVSFDPPVAIPDGGGPVYAFATLSAAGIESGEQRVFPASPAATIARGVLYLPRDMTGFSPGKPDCVPRPVLLDALGRPVLELAPGANDISHLSPGVYFIQSPLASRHSLPATKVVIQD